MNKPVDSHELHQYAFALVDATMVEHLPTGISAERLVPKNLESSAHLMPALLELIRLPTLLLDALFSPVRDTGENIQVPLVALFVKTNVNAQEMARHWNTMQLAQPQPGRRLWLRLHDPRVLHQMLRILTPSQRRKLFGTSTTFTYRISGEWFTAERDPDHESSDQDDIHGGVEPYAGHAKWDWPRIERISLVNRALHSAGIQQAAALTSASLLAEQLMDRAAGRHGLSHQSDLIEFAARGLMTHPAFDEHPAVARVIKPAPTSTEQSSLSDRLALIEEHVWSALRRS